MISRIGFAVLVCAFAALFERAVGADIEPPKYQIVDKYNVNMANGQVSLSQQTVSIGGAMGLAHSISVTANELRMAGNWGFHEKYLGEARYVQTSTNVASSIMAVLRVYDSSGSADFVPYVNGVALKSFLTTPPPYTYLPVGDERHSLVSNNDELVWTKPDGTVVRYLRAPNAAAGASGLLKETDYPNGLIVYVSVLGMQSVNNTAGYQLKYLYVQDTRPMDKPDNPNLTNAPPLLTSSASGWSNRNPRQIVAINNSLEYCAPSAVTCTFANSWPTATITWPPGMPRSLYIGDSQVTVDVAVDNAVGARSKYDFRAFDLGLADPIAGTLHDVSPFLAGREFSPRLIGYTPAGATNPTLSFSFNNFFPKVSSMSLRYFLMRVNTPGVVHDVTNISKTSGSYAMATAFDGNAFVNSGGYGGIDVVLVSPTPGNPDALSYVVGEDGKIFFEPTARNFPISFDRLSAPFEQYEYTRSNLTRIKWQINGVWKVKQEASYPATCTPATQKTCNQADLIKDANGNTTYYTYHAPSGQVATVTLPPNSHGVSPQTRFEYTQLSARYFNGGATKVTGPPIWMKTAERYCINSNFNGSACAANDEVITRYEYNSDNLLLTGATVTDPASGIVHRTCYQYDIYSNQIGTIRPNANATSCN